MKKTLFSIALCLVGICSMYAVSVDGTPIQFVNIYGVMPIDDAQNEDGGGGRPDPTQEIIGSINNRSLHVQMPGDRSTEMADVIVVDVATGETVVEESFVGNTIVNIPRAGSYTAYVVAGNGTVAGNFEVH
jgi:hypothetical protein